MAKIAVYRWGVRGALPLTPAKEPFAKGSLESPKSLKTL
jgi:hypothetical protein